MKAKFRILKNLVLLLSLSSCGSMPGELITNSAIPFLRTPDSCFTDSREFYPYEENYVVIDGLQQHYVDLNKESDTVIVLLHGEPTWGYLYRHQIPGLKELGYRIIVPDMIGFGKSDKPTDPSAYSYDNWENWTKTLLFDELELKNVILVAHDWGGLIGLRLVAKYPDQFIGLVTLNTGLPHHDIKSKAFLKWQRWAKYGWTFDVLPSRRKELVRNGMDAAEANGYVSPFPEKRYMTAPKTAPGLVPVKANHPEAIENLELLNTLMQFDRPVKIIYGENDPFSKTQRSVLMKIKGASGINHPIIKGASHFIQEDMQESLADTIQVFIHKHVAQPKKS